MAKTKTIKSTKDLRIALEEKIAEEIAPQVAVGASSVVAFFEDNKIPSNVNALVEATGVRDQFYINQAELAKAEQTRKNLVAAFSKIPEVVEIKKQLKELHALLYTERLNPVSGKKIPRIPQYGQMSKAYNALQAKLKEAALVYQSVVLVEIEAEIAALTTAIEEDNWASQEQEEWNAGRKEQEKANAKE